MKIRYQTKHKQRFSQLQSMKMAEDEVRRHKLALVDDRITDVLSLLRYGLHVKETEVGSKVLGYSGVAFQNKYRFLFDEAQEERLALESKLKRATREAVKLDKTYHNIETFSQEREVRSQLQDIHATIELTKRKLEALPAANSVTESATFRWRDDTEVKKLGYVKWDKEVNDFILSKKGKELFNRSSEYFEEYKGRVRGGQKTSDQWLTERWEFLKDLM